VLKKTNHDILNFTNKAEQFSHKIKINSEYISPLYEIEFKCLKVERYSADSFKLISYKLIEISDYENLKINRVKHGP